MSDKRVGVDDIVAELDDGMTIGIGGWGSRRKPMAMVRAICRSNLRDLEIVAFGGPDVGLLCAAGKVRKVVYGFVTLDSIALDPHFRAARQNGAVEAMELDEGMCYLGLLAASWRVPFLPARAGLGSDVLRTSSGIRTVISPYDDGEELVAVPALHLDAAIVHLNVADHHGNAAALGPDPFFDDVFLGAASRRFVTAEQVTAPGLLPVPPERILVHRMLTDAVAEVPMGAHFTSCPGGRDGAGPGYGRDEAFQRRYVEAAATPEAWAAFEARYIEVDEAGYQAAVAEDTADGPTA